MLLFYGLIIAGSLLGIIFLAGIFSVLTMAQRGDYHLDKIESRDFIIQSVKEINFSFPPSETRELLAFKK
jgi:hypothetical protein